jgi:hypothetical protein
VEIFVRIPTRLFTIDVAGILSFFDLLIHSSRASLSESFILIHPYLGCCALAVLRFSVPKKEGIIRFRLSLPLHRHFLHVLCGLLGA